MGHAVAGFVSRREVSSAGEQIPLDDSAYAESSLMSRGRSVQTPGEELHAPIEMR